MRFLQEASGSPWQQDLMMVIKGLGLLPTGDTLIYLPDTPTSDLASLLGVKTSFPQFTWIPPNDSDQITAHFLSWGKGCRTRGEVAARFSEGVPVEAKLRRRERPEKRGEKPQKEEQEDREQGR